MKISGDLREKIITFFADPESRQIITSVLKEPKTATTIRTELSLAPSSAYRKISELKDCGLLMIDSFLIKPDGKREALYSCSFSELNVKVEDGIFEFEVVPSAKSLEKRWFELFFSKPKEDSSENHSPASETSWSA